MDMVASSCTFCFVQGTGEFYFEEENTKSKLLQKMESRFNV